MKVASRFMLPVELLLGWLLIVSAVVGGFGRGPLYASLLQRGENLSWFVVFFAIGSMQAGIAMWEWTSLRSAADDYLLQVARVRSSLAFIAGMAWICAMAWLIVDGMARSSMMFVLVAPVATAFNAWAFAENQKVTYALDPQHATTRLQFHR